MRVKNIFILDKAFMYLQILKRRVARKPVQVFLIGKLICMFSQSCDWSFTIFSFVLIGQRCVDFGWRHCWHFSLSTYDFAQRMLDTNWLHTYFKDLVKLSNWWRFWLWGLYSRRNSEAREWRHYSDKTQTNKLECKMIFNHLWNENFAYIQWFPSEHAWVSRGIQWFSFCS